MSSDLISRQAAIDALFSEPLYKSGMKKREADEVVSAIYVLALVGGALKSNVTVKK